MVKHLLFFKIRCKITTCLSMMYVQALYFLEELAYLHLHAVEGEP